jgi:rhomboid protease GluP
VTDITLDKETFATYFARWHMAKKGFVSGTVPEARGLAAASDIVLTRSDGMGFEIMCLVDREAHPEKQFNLSPAAVDEIGKACLKYTGTVHRAKMPLSISILEIGASPITDAQRERLRPLRRQSFLSKVYIFATAADTSTASAWVNVPSIFRALSKGRTPIERLMRMPRAGAAELSSAPAVTHRGGLPVVTCGLLALLAAVFVVEQVFGIGPSTGLLAPSISTLLALGALTQPHVRDLGEWYRLFSGPLLHADAMHLLFNGVALYFAGVVLENLIGRAWFFALFVIGAVSGSVASLAINGDKIISVGASGAIMALLAAAYLCSFRLPYGANRTQVQYGLLRSLIPSLLPLATTGGHTIDFGAHLGGTASGALMAVALLRVWPANAARPRFRRLALLVCAVGLACFGLAAIRVVEDYHYELPRVALIPNDEIPKSDAEKLARSADLVARYPHDPRARLLRAFALINAHDNAGAERELRAGLGEGEALRQLSPAIEMRLRLTLAAVVRAGGRADEARTIAAPGCAASAPDATREQFLKLHLCD